MRSFISVVVLAVAQFFVQASPTPAPSQRSQQPAVPVGTASLTGIVMLSDAPPSPIRRARVQLRESGGTLQTTDTDTSGRFHFDHLAKGTYQVTIDKPGFVPVGHLASADVKDGQAATANIWMQRGAALEGRLLTAEGEPAVAMTVSAIRLGYGPYGKSVVAIRQTTTDDLGRFRVHTLAPGEYYLQAAPDPLRMLSPPSTPARTPRPIASYYAGTSRLNEASAFAVDRGQELRGMDFTLASGLWSKVSARITTSTGKPPASFYLRVQRVGAPAGEVRCFLGLSGPNDNSGFQCPSVPPGDFWLLVAARPAPDAELELAATRISVAGDGQDLLDVAITTTAGASVTGRVEVEGGGPVPANVQIAAIETEYEFPGITPGDSTSSATPPVSVAVDGTFSLKNIAGARVVRLARWPPNWALQSVWLDGAEISDTPSVFAPDKPHVLRVVVTPTTGSASGTVLDRTNQPSVGTRVVVFTDNARRWSARSRFIRSVETGAGGRYLVSGLLPGKYFVAFVDLLDEGAWEDPDVLARLLPTATPIVISGSESVKLDWRIK